jgi:hemerythrin superfamily protein
MADQQAVGDGLDLLMNDHRGLEHLHQRLRSAGEDAERASLAREIVRELSVHATVEEQHLYPLVRETLDDGDALADHALEEHQTIKERLLELDRTDADDAALIQRVDDVMAAVAHHVQEEERVLFARLRSVLDGQRLRELGDQMEKAKTGAPTRPHPHAPNTPPGNLIAGPAAALVDRARDAIDGATGR